MDIEPRAQILDIWRSIVDYAWNGSKWRFSGRMERNSLSDAEQIFCILYPATQIPVLRLDSLDAIAPDVLESLGKLGRDIDVVRAILDIIESYLTSYLDESGRPTFSAGSHVVSDAPSDDAEVDAVGDGPAGAIDGPSDLEVVDAFSMSVSLSLAVIGFVQELRGGVRSPRTLAQITELRRLASERLTAAMAGLLRSFSVHVFEAESEPGRHLMRTLNQSERAERSVIDEFSRSVRDIRTRLREEVTIGNAPGREGLENSNRLFECGWSWGIVRGAEAVDYLGDQVPQRQGVADDRPSLYFTGVALDGIQDLLSPRTRILGLLDDDQQRLANSLQLRWELALQFWNEVATFGQGTWPVEDIPWRTTDGEENDYFTLFVSSMVVQGVEHTVARQRDSSASLVRVGRVLEELASRGRLIRRPVDGDSALALHEPGVELSLSGTELGGPAQSWKVSCFSSLLLKRTLATASLIADTMDRDRLSGVGDQIWHHLHRRQFADGLWDQPANVLPLENLSYDEPSWYHTERVVECLVVASDVIKESPRTSDRLSELAAEYLAEAEHLHDREKLNGTPNTGASMRETFEAIAAKLHRASDLQNIQPATAVTLAQDVLRELDVIATARMASREADR